MVVSESRLVFSTYGLAPPFFFVRDFTADRLFFFFAAPAGGGAGLPPAARLGAAGPPPFVPDLRRAGDLNYLSVLDDEDDDALDTDGYVFEPEDWRLFDGL